MAIALGNACAAAVLPRYHVLYAPKIHHGCSNPRCPFVISMCPNGRYGEEG